VGASRAAVCAGAIGELKGLSMEFPKITHTLGELIELREKLRNAGQGDSASAQYLELLIEQKAAEQVDERAGDV